jgi:hypothetical protein
VSLAEQFPTFRRIVALSSASSSSWTEGTTILRRVANYSSNGTVKHSSRPNLQCDTLAANSGKVRHFKVSCTLSKYYEPRKCLPSESQWLPDHSPSSN